MFISSKPFADQPLILNDAILIKLLKRIINKIHQNKDDPLHDGKTCNSALTRNHMESIQLLVDVRACRKKTTPK